MSVALIGGMDRLETHYSREALRMGVSLKVFTQRETGLASKIGSPDAVVLLTGHMSHSARREVMKVARSRNIRIVMEHSCGICTFRNCLQCLKKTEGGAADA